MKGYWYIFALSALSGIGLGLSDYNLILLIYLCWLIYLHVFSRLKIKITLIASLVFLFFFSYYSLADQLDIDDYYLKENEFTGEVVSDPAITEKKHEFIFYNETIDSKILVKYFNNDKENNATINKNLKSIKYGASCQLKGKLNKPTGATNPGQFDYETYLKQKGINYELLVQTAKDISCQGAKPLHHIYQFRQALTQIINNKLSIETAQWVNALILGNRSLIDQEVINIFQRWGLSHILAISGLHTGIIIGIIYFLLVKLLITTKEKAHLLLILFLPVFALLTGGEPSVWRASLMVLLLLLFNKFKLKYQLLDIFSIVFIVLLIFDQNLIYHIGFQFSFLVTFGLLLSSFLLRKSKSRVYQGLLISFVAQMIILPLQLHYFHFFQPLSILLNMIVIPYFSLFVIPTMFMFLFLLLLPDMILKFFDSLFVYINNYFLMVLKFINKHFDYALLIGDISIKSFILYYMLFFVLMSFLQQGKLSRSFGAGLLLVCLLCGLALRPYFSPIGTVTMLDIGQGDAFIIELPYRRGVFMIDAGSQASFPDFEPTDYVYYSIIQPYLNKRSIYNIDAVFLSHEHVDHYGSMFYLIKDKNVGSVVVSSYFEWEDQLDEELQKNNIMIKTVEFKEQVILKGQEFYVLSPNYNMNSPNDNSLVLYTRFGPKSWIFTGDIEKKAENHLIDLIDQLHVDVLKVPHHGSKTSTNSEFLRKLNVKYGLIPVGLNNTYGHPADEVLNTLEQEGVHIFRTDNDGAVQFYYDENNAVFKKYNKTK